MSASEQKEEIAGAIVVKRRGDGKEVARDEPALSALADDVLLQILGRLEEDLGAGVLRVPAPRRAPPGRLLPATPVAGAPRRAPPGAIAGRGARCVGRAPEDVRLLPRPPPRRDPPRALRRLRPRARHRPRPHRPRLVLLPRAHGHLRVKNHRTCRVTGRVENQRPTGADDAAVWSLYDDLYLDAAYDCTSEAHTVAASAPTAPAEKEAPAPAANAVRRGVVSGSRRRPRRWLGPVGAHLASGSWTLSREQGNKLLASRFRGDRLYICDWPGCVHAEERRKYMVFRGVFQDFARSQVRRALRDTRRTTVAVDCAFCECTEAWDLYSAFCLRNFYGYHDDGEPVVRAYVCDSARTATSPAPGPSAHSTPDSPSTGNSTTVDHGEL